MMRIRKDLDEYSDEALQEELQRRVMARQKGDCDYCGRKLDSLPCHFAKRHKASLQPLAVVRAR